MERREAISLLREVLEACHETIAPYMIDARPPLSGKPMSESKVDELWIRVSLTTGARSLLKRIAEKRGLQMHQTGDLIRICKAVDQPEIVST
jgi:hypothetical protein